jgi:predicted dehydrogenase
MACHLLDPIYWALDLDAPCKVTAAGGRYVLDDICETPDTMEAVWEYGPKGDRDDPLQVVWSLTEGNARGFAGHGVGMALYGSNATVVFDFFTHEIIAEGDRLAGTTKPKPSIPSSPGHHREFLDAIKSRTRCSCDVEYGHRLSNVPHMANIAFRTGRTLSWDNEREQFIDAPEADRLLARAYRVPYVLPV